MKWVLLILVLTLSLIAQDAIGVPRAEFFSEGAYRTGLSTGNNSLFARAFAQFNQSFQPFLQMGAVQTFGEQASEDLYIAPGIHWQESILKVYGEHRFHPSSDNNSPLHEWRALFVAGDLLDFPLSPHSRFLAFWEPYTELLFSSNDENHILLQGLSRFGLRYQFAAQTSTDVFLEPYLSFLNNSEGNNNQFQLRPSLRAQLCLNGLCISFSAARLLPTGNDMDQGFRFLATVGGPI